MQSDYTSPPASWLVHLTPDQVVLGSILFLGKTIYSHSASLHPGIGGYLAID